MEALHDVVQGRQGALHRRVVDVGLAVRQGAARGRTQWLDAVRVHAEPLQPAVPRGRARDAAAVPDQGIGVIPWSPLARGRLTRPWDEDTERSATDEFGKTLYNAPDSRPRASSKPSREVAEKRGVPRAQVALAWVLRQAGHHRADRRGVQTAPPRRCRGGAVVEAERRGDRRTGGTLRTACRGRASLAARGFGYGADRSGFAFDRDVPVVPCDGTALSRRPCRGRPGACRRRRIARRVLWG